MSAYLAIHNQIKQQGAMPFVAFMQEALFNPQFGYYTSGLPKFGVSGDFTTAPEMTPLFGYALANQCAEVMAGIEKPELFEFGAGSGRLCVDILTRLEALDCLPVTYYILDVSADLKSRQKTLIADTIPHLLSRVNWLTRLPDKPFSGVMIANEVLDAMPVHRFMQVEEGLMESYITLNEKGKLTEEFKPCRNQHLKTYLHGKLPDGVYPYQSEANLLLEGWIKAASEILGEGAFLIIDYGFPRHEYYHPQRVTGTLMCHYRQRAHPDFLAHPGEEDITAHVDFTHVAEAADASGFHVAGFASQASFLLANGILELLQDVADQRLRIKQQQAVKQLLQAHEMGELFKVLALTQHFDGVGLKGFSLQDRRASL